MAKRARSKHWTAETAMMQSVMRPHLEMSTRLLKLVESCSSADETAWYCVPAVITFLAGLDKTIGVALLLCYLAGRISLKQIGDSYDRLGILHCRIYTGKKLQLLQELGFNISDLWWYVELRNRYLHFVALDCGFRVSAKRAGSRGLEVIARPLHVSCFAGEETVIAITPADLKERADKLIDQLGAFLRKQRWRKGFDAVNRELRSSDSTLEESIILQAAKDDDFERMSAELENLNDRILGRGYKNILRRGSQPSVRSDGDSDGK